MIYRVLLIIVTVCVSVYTASYGVWEFRNHGKKSSIPICIITTVAAIMTIAVCFIY